MRGAVVWWASVLAAGCVLQGCVPYSLGTTAQTLPKGSGTMSWTYSQYYGAGDRIDPLRRGISGEDVPSLDAEFRLGIDERSDFGLRFVQLGGLSGTYKRRVVGAADLDEPVVAMMTAARLVGQTWCWSDLCRSRVARERRVHGSPRDPEIRH